MSRLVGQLGVVAWLSAVWVGLWGSLTVANVLGGVVVAVVLLVLLPLPAVASRNVVRPLGVLRFVAYFAVDLVRASVQVLVLVLRPRGELRQAVVAIQAVGTSDQLLTLLANAISLTPGTLTLEVDRPRRVLYVHLLQLDADRDAVERVRRDILRLERLAIEAIGSAQCRKASDTTPGVAP
jgi:multicomponent Na+:H+ antiporter subunit E